MVRVVATGFAPAITEGGENEHELRVGRPAVQAKETGPVNPLLPPMVMVKWAGWPEATVWGGGGSKEKSGMGAGTKVAVTFRAAFIVT
jgi:hypothetical protein